MLSPYDAMRLRLYVAEKAPLAGEVKFVRGGPWETSDKNWEIWLNGKRQWHSSDGTGYRVVDGSLRNGACGYSAWSQKVFPGHEVRAPEGYTGACPEGMWEETTPGERTCETCRFHDGVCRRPANRLCYAPTRRCWQPKDKPAEKFKVGDRVRNRVSQHTGTLLSHESSSNRWRWYIDGRPNRDKGSGYNSPSNLVHLPASEDPLPRPPGVIVYEVSQEEFAKICPNWDYPWMFHRDGDTRRNPWVYRKREGAARRLCEEAKPGETWIICRTEGP